MWEHHFNGKRVLFAFDQSTQEMGSVVSIARKPNERHMRWWVTASRLLCWEPSVDVWLHSPSAFDPTELVTELVDILEWFQGSTRFARVLL